MHTRTTTRSFTPRTLPTLGLALGLGLLPVWGGPTARADSPDQSAPPAAEGSYEAVVHALGYEPDTQPLPEDIPNGAPTPLAIGADAPGFNLPGVDGKMHSLDEYADADVLMVVFTCNHCPDAQLAEESLKNIVNDYADRSFQLVAISSNNARGIRPDELSYSVHGDSFKDMVNHARDYEFNFPYLYDGETQEVGRAYGGLASPHCFIFDADRKLRYHGRVNNLSRRNKELTQTQARDAIDAIFAGQEIEEPVTRAHGCSTKWLFKIDAVAQDQAKWEALPVTLDEIDADGVAALVANDTRKLRLINIWSTTCGPCIAEMPDLVMVNRNYQNRQFEFITISTDAEDQAGEALRFLELSHAALGRTAANAIEAEGRSTNNYIWAGGELDALAEALDPEWQGPLPHTLLVAPGGEVLYRYTGEVDIFELRHKIVDYLGRY